MWLLIDIGNSAAKVGLWDGTRVVRTARLDAAPSLAGWLDGAHVAAAGCVCVVPDRAPAWKEAVFAETEARLHFFDATSPLPVTITYKTPATLGNDRIAAACGGWIKHGVPGQKGVLVVDAGTAATFELVRANAEYAGGIIAPGPELLRRALRDGTAQLQQVELEAPPSGLGTSTNEAIRAGVMFGFQATVEGLVRMLQEEEKSELTLVLTGGWGEWLSKRLDMDHYLETDLVLEGVACLLQIVLSEA